MPKIIVDRMNIQAKKFTFEQPSPRERLYTQDDFLEQYNYEWK